MSSRTDLGRSVRSKSKGSRSTNDKQSPSRKRVKKSKSPSRAPSKSRESRVFTKKELASTSTRMTRSKTMLLNKEEEVVVDGGEENAAKKMIEDLKKDIADLVNMDLAKEMGLSEETKISEPEVVDEGLRKRKSVEKEIVVDAEQQEAEKKGIEDGFKYSGYLKYKNKNIFSIVVASLVVIFIFVVFFSKVTSFF